MKNKNDIVFKKEIYGEKSIIDYIRLNVLPYVPYWTMEDLKKDCDILFERYGYVHDVGFNVVIKQHHSIGRDGNGWTEAEQKYKEEMNLVRWKWDIAENAYH